MNEEEEGMSKEQPHTHAHTYAHTSSVRNVGETKTKKRSFKTVTSKQPDKNKKGKTASL